MSKMSSTDQRIIYSLSSISNLPSDYSDSSVEKIEAQTKDILIKIFRDSRIIKLIGEWKLVWGPKVNKGDLSPHANNAIYVVQSLSEPNPNQFVVAISGTNPKSVYDWIFEDAKICPPVPWIYGTQSVGNITHGTSIGMRNLNKLKDNNLTFVKYLASQVSNKQDSISVTVTGHSLGGALSPAIALSLLDSQGISLDEPNGWDPDLKSQISVMPTAGPSPGDEVWADYYDRRIGCNTVRVWNDIDIVPHAWQISMLYEIPGLYNPTILPSKKIQDKVNCAVANAKAFESIAGDKIKQICASVPGFCGQVDPKLKTFLEQASYQHTTAYSKFLGTTEFDDIVKNIKEATKATGCGCSCM